MRRLVLFSIAIPVFILALGSSGSAQVLFEDDCTTPGVNPANWFVHGTGVVNPGGFLVLSCSYWWDDGVESSGVAFDRPGAGQCLTVEGWFMMSPVNPRSASIAWLQDGWGHPYNGYSVEFAKDQDAPGDNAVFFGVQIDDSPVEYLRIGDFTPGEWIGWRVCVLPVGCQVYLDTGDGFALEHATAEGDFPIRVNLHGSGDTLTTGCDNYSFWDNITVALEPLTATESSTWGRVKSVYR